MNSSIKTAITKLINATSYATMAHWLQEVVGEIINEDPQTREVLIQEVCASVKNEATKNLNAHQAAPSHNPWYVATGTEATLLYIACELESCDGSNDPRIQLATLDYAATNLANANDSPIPNTNRAREILTYCEAEYGCVERSRYATAALILPDVDIDCLAECPVLDSDLFAMVINAQHIRFPVIETFSYELAALLIASEGIQDPAIDLLMQTTSPGIKGLGDDEQFWEYLLAVKMGLAYGGPYASFVDDTEALVAYGPIWREYLKHR